MHRDAAPRRVGDAVEPQPLHDVARTREAEAAALATHPTPRLMDRAGHATARMAMALAPHARRCTVLVGPGNNGGDGLVAACHLHRAGRSVRLWHLGMRPGAVPPPDAAQAWHEARALPLHWTTDPVDAVDADLVIDGLLGIGATRPPDGPMAEVIRATSASGVPTLAIDVPSGLDADAGRSLGEACVRAHWTLTLLTLKPGLFTASGRDAAGDVWFDPLGVTVGAQPQAWLAAATTAPSGAPAARRHVQHKGSFGDVLVVGGATGMQGAAVLAGRAALTAGAGRVYLSCLDPAPIAQTPVELMSRPQAWTEPARRLADATVVCGCGGGPPVAGALPPLLAHAGRLVLDADALNAVAADPALAQAMRARADRGQATVLTPHPLEAARLLGRSAADVQARRLDAASELATRLQAVVVLKGSGTVVAAPGTVPWINATGNARLATPGSGDVLAGWIGGGWSPHPRDDGRAAACHAVWLHGRAADTAPGRPDVPVRAADLIDLMAAVAWR